MTVVLVVLNVALVGGAFASGMVVGHDQGYKAHQKETQEIVREFVQTVRGDVDLSSRRFLADAVLKPMVESELIQDLSAIGEIATLEEIGGGTYRAVLLTKNGDERVVIVDKENTEFKGHISLSNFVPGVTVIVVGDQVEGQLEAKYVRLVSR